MTPPTPTATPTTTPTATSSRTTDTPAAPAPPVLGVAPRTAARLAGAAYIVLFALGIFANFFVREGLIVTDDAEATAANIAESMGLFRLGMVSFLIIFLLDVVVAWALHIVFRDGDADLSRLTAWFRLVYTVFLGVAVIFFFQALQLLNGAEFLDVVGAQERNAQALVAIDTFNSTWLIGLLAFGIHVILLGVLLLRSGTGPRLLGYVLLVAGSAYVIDTVAHTVLSNYTDYETAFIAMVAVPAVIAEGWFGLWLLLRAGGRRPALG